MKRGKQQDFIVALDVGTSKVATLVGELDENNQINIIGYNQQPSRGLKRGVVVNIEAISQSIQKAIEEAETMANCHIQSAYVNISGSHIKGYNSNGIVPIKNQQVASQDIDSVMEAASAVPIPADQKVLHVIPQEYLIDNQDSIKSPIGMSGVRLEAKVHLVTGSTSSADNLVNCVENYGLEVEELIVSPLACSQAVLTEDEKELGVCMIDIGAGTTDLVIYINGSIHYTAVIPMGGDQITNDIAVVLRLPTQQAEQLKCESACALRRLTNPEELIDIPNIVERQPRRWTKQNLAEVVEARFEEIMHSVKKHIENSGLEEYLGAGIVITGGSAKMTGVMELAEEIFHVPVRMGYIKDKSIQIEPDLMKDLSYTTALGLIKLSQENFIYASGYSTSEAKDGFWQGVTKWFQSNF